MSIQPTDQQSAVMAGFSRVPPCTLYLALHTLCVGSTFRLTASSAVEPRTDKLAMMSISEDDFSRIQKRISVTSEIVDRLTGPFLVFFVVASRCLLAAEISLMRLASRLSYTQNCLPGRLELSGYLGNGCSIIQPS